MIVEILNWASAARSELDAVVREILSEANVQGKENLAMQQLLHELGNRLGRRAERTEGALNSVLSSLEGQNIIMIRDEKVYLI